MLQCVFLYILFSICITAFLDHMQATSALDASSEKLVQQSIDALQRSKSQTTVVVAHRLSTIRNADKIAVVEGGVIAEVGTHTELIEKNGR